MDLARPAGRPLSRRRALRLFGLGVAGVALGGCAAPLARSAAPTAIPIQRRAGEVAVWSAAQAPAGQANWQGWAAQAFVAATGKRLRFTPFADAGKLGAAVAANIAAGKPPDVATASPAQADAWSRQGLLQPLDARAGGSPTAQDQFFAAAVAPAQVDGHLYGLPQAGLDFAVLYANLRRFSTPTALSGEDLAKWNWDSLAKKTAPLSSGQGASALPGFWYQPPDFATFATWLHSDAGSIYREDGGRLAFADGRGEQTLQFFVDLVTKYKMRPPATTDDPRALLASGKLPVLYGRASDMQAILGAAGKDDLLVTLPILPGPGANHSAVLPWSPSACVECLAIDGYTSFGGTSVAWAPLGVLPKGASQPDLAWQYLTFAAGLDAAQAGLRLTGLPGPQRAFFSTPAWQETVRQNFAFASWPDIAESAGSFPARAFDVLDAAATPLLLDAYAGKRPVRDALDEAMRRGDAAIRGKH